MHELALARILAAIQFLPAMSLYTNANKWAPKLVIILQLFTWTVVGLIFLQRGAISLGASTKDRKNDSHVQVIAANNSKIAAHSAMLSRKEALRMAPHGKQQGDETNRYQPKTPKESFFDIMPRWIKHSAKLSSNDARSDSSRTRSGRTRSSKTESNASSSDFREDRFHKEDYDVGMLENHSVEDRYVRRTNQTANFETVRALESAEDVLLVSDKRIRDSARTNESAILSRGDNAHSSGYNYFLSNTTNNVSSESVRGEKRSNDVQLSPVNRAGAAAAVVMLAIGVVMLLLGPAIVILRAFDTRRRDRRLPKSRSRKDLPPTYEQAMSMDQVPRYSTLHLNVIPEPTFPPSPTRNHESLFVFTATEDN